MELFSQGGAFVHKLVCGTMALVPVIERPTPYHRPHSTQVAGYHRPHSTQVAGYAAIYGGDDRYIGNVFLDGDVAQVYGPDARVGHAARHGTARVQRTSHVAGRLHRSGWRLVPGRP